MLRFKLIATVIVLSLMVVSAYADEKTDKVDKLFSQWDTDKTPGAAIAIIQNGKIIYEKGYGMANLEHDIPLSPDSVFRIASVSKQFTAACIARLALDKKLDLDASILKYFPELPADVYSSVTIRHLVHHTSGVRDYLTLAYLAGLEDYDYYSAREAVSMLVRQKALNFNPGDEYLYSNSGYLLLALLVERVSGKTLNEYAAEKLFKPLQMNSTQFYDDHTRIVPKRADGYSASPEGYKINMTTLDLVGDGGIFTTVRDMSKWLEALQGRGPFDQDFLDLLTYRKPLNDGKENNYAFGLGIRTRKGKRIIAHGGAFVGFRAYMAIYPDEQFSLVCLANHGNIRLIGISGRIADIYLFEDSEQKKKSSDSPAPKSPSFVDLSEDQLAKYSGAYRNAETEDVYKVWAEKGLLHAHGLPGYHLTFKPLSTSRFMAVSGIPGLEVEFSSDKSTGSRSFSIYRNGEQRDTFHEFKPFDPGEEFISAVSGIYYSEELSVTYRFALHKGELKVTVADHLDPIELNPTMENTFTSDYGTIRFSQDAGKNYSFTIDSGRVKGLRFVKK